MLFGIFSFMSNFDIRKNNAINVNVPTNSPILPFSIPNLYISGYIIDSIMITPATLPSVIETVSSMLIVFLIQPIINDIIRVINVDIITTISAPKYFAFTAFSFPFGSDVI